MYECEGKTVPPIDPATIEPEVLAGLMSGLLQPDQRSVTPYSLIPSLANGACATRALPECYSA